MKSETNFPYAILVGIALFCIGAIIGVKYQKQPETPQYTTSDSLSKDSAEKRIKIADSLAFIYRANADRYKSEKDKLSKSNYKLSELVKELLKNPTAKCEDKLSESVKLNDSLQVEIYKCDSAYNEIDKEAQMYSDEIVDLKKINSIEIKRNKRLSFEMDSTIGLYKDSLKFERKTLKKERSKKVFYKITTTVAAALGIYGIVSK